MSLSKLRKLYPGPQFIHLEQVRSSTGNRPDNGERSDDLTIADLIILNTWKSQGSTAGLDLRYFEYKVSASDLGAEIRAGAHKSKLAAYCTETWLAVSSQKNVVPDLGKLSPGWGCVDVGGAKPHVVREPEKREPQIPPADFLRALFRAASSQDVEAIAASAPMVTIDRPDLSRSRVGCSCTHSQPKPLDKVLPRKIPCFNCAEGRPREPVVVEAMIEDASDEVLRGYAQVLQRQMLIRGLRIEE